MKKIGAKTVALDGKDDGFFPLYPFDVELMCVDSGLKPALRTLIPRAEISKVTRILESRKLHFIFSEHAYSEFTYRLEKTGTGGCHILYASKSRATVDKLNRIDNEDPFVENSEIGRILGYPDCCIELFSSIRDIKRHEYLRIMIKNSKRLRAPLNIIEAKFAVVSHYPCSFDCPHSLSMADDILDLMKQRHPAAAAKYSDFLSAPFLFSPETDTYFRFGKTSKVERDIFYGNVIFQLRSRPESPDDDGEIATGPDIIKAIDSAGHIRANGKNIVFIDGIGMQTLSLKSGKPFYLLDFSER